MGEDVGRLGGVFRATAGLQERFGADRCVDTPLAEAGILGTAVGLCMAGWRPVCEMQYDAFSYPALDQLINHVGRYRWRTRGKMSFPLTIRMPYGGGVRAPELHDDSPETYYVHTPGVKVAIPSTPADAKGLLAAAIRDPDPVVVLEPKLIYRTARGEVPEGEHVVPLGQRASRGRAPTSRSSRTARWCRSPSARPTRSTDEASCEVLDLRTLKPLDEDVAPRLGREDRPRDRRAGGAARRRVRGRGRRGARREGDLRPPRARCYGSPATTCPTRTGRSRTRTCRRSSGSSTRRGVCWPRERPRDPARAADPPRPLLARPRAAAHDRLRRHDRVRVPRRRLARGAGSASTSSRDRRARRGPSAHRARSRSGRPRRQSLEVAIDRVVPGTWGW